MKTRSTRPRRADCRRVSTPAARLRDYADGLEALRIVAALRSEEVLLAAVDLAELLLADLRRAVRARGRS